MDKDLIKYLKDNLDFLKDLNDRVSKLEEGKKNGIERWVVFFIGKNKGYYSEKQPNFNWSITEDITKANLYKTKKGALNLIKRHNNLFLSDNPMHENHKLFGEAKLKKVILIIKELKGE